MAKWLWSNEVLFLKTSSAEEISPSVWDSLSSCQSSNLCKSLSLHTYMSATKKNGGKIKWKNSYKFIKVHSEVLKFSLWSFL